jgi:lipid A 3-O-deacylase
MRRAHLLVLSAALFAGDGMAADLAPAPTSAPVHKAAFGFLSEARLGVFAHDPWSPESGSVDINGELLSVKPFALGTGWDVAVPRLHLGASVNTQGKTSNVYAGFTWSLDLTTALFIEASLGGAVNNGATGTYVPADMNAVGCHASFRESASLGFRLTDQISLMGTVEHYSNGGICDRNRGVTNVGVRLGYSF